MTNVKIKIRDGFYDVEAKGHSGYAPIGTDIVCAGITALIRAFDDYTEGKKIYWKMEAGNYNILCEITDETTTALNMLISGLGFIQENFPENLKLENYINIQEVENMNETKNEKSERLQLFAEGAGGEAGGEGHLAGDYVEASYQEEADKKDKTGTQNTGMSSKGKASFDELIGGDYREDFEAAVNKRLEEKENEILSLNEQMKKHNELLDMLSLKYEVKDKNIDEVLKLAGEDDSYFEEAAAREGLTVKQYKEMQKLQRQQEEYQAMKQAELARTQAQRDIQKWFKESEALKEIYPNFDLKEELKNRDFVGLLKNGINVKIAYEVFHVDDITRGAAKLAAQNAEKNTVAKLQQKAARPVENGTNAQSGAVLKSGMSNLTKTDRAELARRAQRGEIIRF